MWCVLLLCRDTDIAEVGILLFLATDNTLIVNTPISEDINASQHLGAAFNLFFFKIKGGMQILECSLLNVYLLLLF